MKKTFNNRRNTETQQIENSQRFQGSFRNYDKEILKKKGIKSPDITKMPFKVTEGKTIRFFASEKKYNDYLKKQIV